MLDEPDVKFAGLSIWARSRAYPQCEDFWDGNWLDIRAEVKAPGALVEISGPWIRNVEIASFAAELEIVYRNLSGTAQLQCIEPMLGVKVACGSTGHLLVTIDITPHHLDQKHHFVFTADQTYLPDVLAGCRRLLERFPIKDPNQSLL